MLISTAYAQAGAAPPPGQFDPMGTLVPLALIMVVFYFLLIRPQQKKVKEHKTMIDNLRRGDRVITGGGILGTVTRVAGEDELVVEIAEGVRVRCVKGTVTAVLAKPEPGKASRAEERDADDDKPAEQSGKAARK